MRRMSVVGAVAAAVALLGACGGGDDGASPEVASLGTDPVEPADTPDISDASGSSDTSDSRITSATSDGQAAGEVPTASAPTASAPTDPEEAMLAYTECMRDHGIDMPDPEFSDDGGVRMAVEVDEGNAEEFEAAEAECSPMLEAARSEVEIDPEREAELREEMLAYTECMRDHGIDMPDPVFDDNGGITMQQGGPGEGGEPVDIGDDDEFRAANEACGREGGPVIRSGNP